MTRTPPPRNHQLEAWRGGFGDAYIERNTPTESIIEARVMMWNRILSALGDDPPKRILEIGANIGLNLRALRRLTDASLTAIEPNATARAKLIADEVVPAANIHDGIASDVPLSDGVADLVFTSGVLIHVPPENLAASCAEIYRLSSKYIVCCEYFAVHSEEVTYRGETEMLFKRDFGDFWMSQHPDLSLVDYGFFWKRATGLDNLTWWLFRKG